jgi:PhzF family phenazine biosynthesis protein
MYKFRFNMKTSSIIEVQLLNAFVDQGIGGNPAGVVLDADALTADQKQAIARKTGLSETAFVSKSTIADFKLDFFTPTRQIAHCGHATIATFSFLAQTGVTSSNRSSKETIDGKREILLVDDLAFMEQKAPQYQSAGLYGEQIIKSLNLAEQDLLPGAPILKVNTGNSFIIVPVAGPEVLKRIEPDFELITQISEELDLIGFYVFCLLPNNRGRDADTRMFAPRYGIQEEAATGMAAGPLACYMYDRLLIKKDTFLIQQGNFMVPPSPSVIQVNISLKADQISSLMVGGKGIQTGKITIVLE